MDEFIRRQMIRYRPTPLTAVVVGVAFASLGASIRWAIGPVVQGGVPFMAFFPMLLIAALVSGGVGGLACLAASTLIASIFLIPPFGIPTPAPSVALFTAFGAMIVYVAAMLRRTLIELTEAAQQERVFTLELQHRVKNTLAVVQSLAAQTARASQNTSDFRRDFGERLIAVAEAHNVLSEAGWRSVSLRSIAERVLNPFARTGRVKPEGPDVWLNADQAVNLALAFHELATNACKHGALSNEGGQVGLSWSHEACNDRVAVRWTETGGPPVRSPASQGFGARLLTRGMGGSAVWRPALDFAPDGLRWNVTFETTGGPEPQKPMPAPARRSRR